MKFRLLPLLISAVIAQPVLTILGQQTARPGTSLFLSESAPLLDEMKLEFTPGPPVEAKSNPAPEDFRGLYEWPRKDGTKARFQYQGFRWSKRKVPGGKLWGINLVLNFGSAGEEIAGRGDCRRCQRRCRVTDETIRLPLIRESWTTMSITDFA